MGSLPIPHLMFRGFSQTSGTCSGPMKMDSEKRRSCKYTQTVLSGIVPGCWGNLTFIFAPHGLIAAWSIPKVLPDYALRFTPQTSWSFDSPESNAGADYDITWQVINHAQHGISPCCWWLIHKAFVFQTPEHPFHHRMIITVALLSSQKRSMSYARIIALTSLAIMAFAGNSLLCRVALTQTGIDAASMLPQW